MFNTTNHNNTNIKTPAAGIIQKSNAKSYFIKFHQTSQLASEIFTDEPEHKRKRIEVLQVLLINDGYVLVELVKTEDL